ncbi:MAG: FkbM family methyltransferase [Hyphomicrobium sp.]|nr:FkbM family methyltransferase [Hyphomicrobium sp.]
MASVALQGVWRSLRVYHGAEAPRVAMDALYARFIKPGDLAFDIGAHVGDRVSSFRRLGARVVALEPQPLLQRALHLIHGRDPAVILVPAAVAAERGLSTLHVNTRNPTVSTLSSAFLVEADGAEGWQGQSWDTTLTVPVVTLDRLIATFGPPAFIKIDIEGYEDEALRGLTQPVPALSFEFTTIARDVAQRCLEMLMSLGDYRFDVALGESQTLTFGRWITAAEMSKYLELLPHAANSGDVYAVLSPNA